jgi:hypothetical protein
MGRTPPSPNEMFSDFNKMRAEIVHDTGPRRDATQAFRPHAHACRLTQINEGSRWRQAQRYRETDSRHDFQVHFQPQLHNTRRYPGQHRLGQHGLKMAREVDPEGTRAIGVLTKADLM